MKVDEKITRHSNQSNMPQFAAEPNSSTLHVGAFTN